MKYFFLVLGLLLVLLAVIQLSRFIFSLSQLSEYGQGFMVGNVILLVIGVLLAGGAYKSLKAK